MTLALTNEDEPERGRYNNFLLSMSCPPFTLLPSSLYEAISAQRPIYLVHVFFSNVEKKLIATYIVNVCSTMDSFGYLEFWNTCTCKKVKALKGAKFSESISIGSLK